MTLSLLLATFLKLVLVFRYPLTLTISKSCCIGNSLNDNDVSFDERTPANPSRACNSYDNGFLIMGMLVALQKLEDS